MFIVNFQVCKFKKRGDTINRGGWLTLFKNKKSNSLIPSALTMLIQADNSPIRPLNEPTESKHAVIIRGKKTVIHGNRS